MRATNPPNLRFMRKEGSIFSKSQMAAYARCVHREIKRKSVDVSCAEPSSVSALGQCLRRCDLFGQARNWRGGLWRLRCNLRPIQISAGDDPPSRWRVLPDMKPSQSLQKT